MNTIILFFSVIVTSLFGYLFYIVNVREMYIILWNNTNIFPLVEISIELMLVLSILSFFLYPQKKKKR